MLSYINKNWSIARRLTVIAVLGLFPCAPLLYGVVASELADIETAKREMGGLEAQKKVWTFMNAAEHGSAGDKAFDLKSIAALYPQQHSIAGDADRMIATRDTVARANIGAQIMESIASGSGLILDPESASYFLMDVVSLRNGLLRHQLTAVEERLRQHSGTGPLDPDGFAQLSLMAHKASGILQIGERLKAANEATGKQMTSALLPLQNFKHWHDQLENSSKLDINVIRSAVRPLRDAVERIWQTGHVELQRLLSDRIDRKWGHAAGLTGIVISFAVFVCAIAILIARAFARTLNHQIEALDRLSRADDSVKLNCTGYHNEIRLISDALVRMKDSLAERRTLASEADKQVAEKEALNAHYAEAHEIFMKEFRSAAQRLAAGDFQHPITAVVIDEYREIVDVMNATFKQLDQVQTSIKAADSQRDLAIAAVGEALSKLAEGDLSARIDAGLAREFEKLEADFNTAVQQLELTIGEVKSNANSIKQGIDEISVASDDLSRRTENQAATLEQTSAAVAEITMAVAKTSEGASQANTVVSNTKADAVHSGEIVANAIVAMAAIEKSSQQINQIISVIDEIAFQTNLLALNAGVEAARAGEAGRGFAVVASEVRALAQRSAEAAKQIKGLISTSSKEVTTGVELVGETGRALKRIVEQVGSVSTAVAEIAASAKQQSIGLSQVNTAVSQMDQVTQQNAAMVEEATAATRGLKQQTEELSAQIERFKTSNRGMSEALHSMSGRMAAAAKPRESFAKGKTAKMKVAAAASGTKRLAVANDGWEEF